MSAAVAFSSNIKRDNLHACRRDLATSVKFEKII